MFNTHPDPQDFQPATIADLIGPAARVGQIVTAKVERLLVNTAAPSGVRLLFAGDPGTGKTELALFTACQLTGDRLRDLRAGMATGGTMNVEARNGRLVDAERVRRWMDNLRMGSLFGGWQVKLVNEMDLISTAGQDLLLDYLDAIRNVPGQAFIGTSNKSTAELTARYQSRFQHFEVAPPTEPEVASFLASRWDIPMGEARMIALGACGNVRQALLDAQSVVDCQLCAA